MVGLRSAGPLGSNRSGAIDSGTLARVCTQPPPPVCAIHKGQIEESQTRHSLLAIGLQSAGIIQRNDKFFVAAIATNYKGTRHVMPMVLNKQQKLSIAKMIVKINENDNNKLIILGLDFNDPDVQYKIDMFVIWSNFATTVMLEAATAAIAIWGGVPAMAIYIAGFALQKLGVLPEDEPVIFKASGILGDIAGTLAQLSPAVDAAKTGIEMLLMPNTAS